MSQDKTAQPDIDPIDAKRQELSDSLKCNVYPLVFNVDGEEIVGYLREPQRIVKMRALDKVMTSPSSAGQDILLACLIPDESDKRILSEDAAHDSVYIGACLAAAAIVEVSMNTYKKK